MNISLRDFVEALSFLGYRVTITLKEPQDTKGECEAECACEPNPFIERHKQETAELEHLGLEDLKYWWQQNKVKREAEKQIKEANITDENDKLRVYRNVKRQFLEYQAYLKG